MSKKKQSAVSSQQSAGKPVAIIVTVLPPKAGKRKIMISAAPEGEMPIVLTGLFLDRHALMDQAYGAVMRREPQIVTVKEKTYKAGETHDEDKGKDLDEHVGADEESGESDQVVGEPSPPTPLPESGEGSEAHHLMPVSESELPAIEEDERG